MVQQDGRVFFSLLKLSNAGNMVTVLRKGTHLWIRGIVSSDPSTVIRRTNCKTLHEHCNQKYTRLVTV